MASSTTSRRSVKLSTWATRVHSSPSTTAATVSGCVRATASTSGASSPVRSPEDREPDEMTELPPLIVASLKMYLGVAAIRAWVADLAGVGARLDAGASIEFAVLPTFPLLESTAKTLAGTGIRWGAQDVAASADGAQTGEVSVEVLAELGCRYVEIAHSERRRLFGEDDASIQAKVAQVVGAGLVPLYCVGENERGAPPEAAQACLAQLETLLDVAAGKEVVIAYEPVWATGAGRS